MGDDQAFDRLAVARQMSSDPAHVARGLTDHAVGRATTLEFHDDEPTGGNVPAEEVQAPDGRGKLVPELARLRLPELKRAAPIDAFPVGQQELF